MPSGCSSLTSVTIPSSVTAIRDYAFDGCSSLTSVDIPATAEVADNAFPPSTEIRRLDQEEELEQEEVEAVVEEEGEPAYPIAAGHATVPEGVRIGEDAQILRKEEPQEEEKATMSTTNKEGRKPKPKKLKELLNACFKKEEMRSLCDELEVAYLQKDPVPELVEKLVKEDEKRLASARSRS